MNTFELKKIFKNVLNLDLEKDFIFIKNTDLRYIYANSKFCELFNIKLSELIGKNDSFIFKDKALIEICRTSDLEAFEKNHSISVEEIFNINFRVLKIKISLGNNKVGILGFAKLELK